MGRAGGRAALELGPAAAGTGAHKSTLDKNSPLSANTRTKDERAADVARGTAQMMALCAGTKTARRTIDREKAAQGVAGNCEGRGRLTRAGRWHAWCILVPPACIQPWAPMTRHTQPQPPEPTDTTFRQLRLLLWRRRGSIVPITSASNNRGIRHSSVRTAAASAIGCCRHLLLRQPARCRGRGHRRKMFPTAFSTPARRRRHMCGDGRRGVCMARVGGQVRVIRVIRVIPQPTPFVPDTFPALPIVLMTARPPLPCRAALRTHFLPRARRPWHSRGWGNVGWRGRGGRGCSRGGRWTRRGVGPGTEELEVVELRYGEGGGEAE
jgi:hypothetical protein